MKKRILAGLLSVVLLVSCISTDMVVYATDQENTGVNIAMLESLLDERSWVIETLVNDNYSNNPYILYDSYANGTSMMSQTLSAYEDENDPNYIEAYTALVDIMEKVYNGESYVSGVVDFVTGFKDFFGSEEDAQDYADDIVASVGELQYEQIMYEVLSADYTSSSGETINNLDSQLMNVRRLQESMENLEEFTTFLTLFAQDSTGSSIDGVALDSYINDFLLPYIDSIDDFLSNFEKVQSNPNGDAVIAMLTAYAMIDIYDRFETTETSLGDTIAVYAPNYLLSSETLAVIKAANKTVSIASSALDSYTFIETMQIQQDSVASPIRAMADITSDDNMEQVLNYVADLIEAESDETISNYDVIVSTLRGTSTVSSIATELVSKGVQSLTEKVFNVATANMISSTISKGTAMVGIGSWCIDEAVGFKETCKKIYELKYLDSLIDIAVNVYQQKLVVYNILGTDEAAQDVIDTLSLLQKLRLRGETISYKITSSQLDSLVGKWLSNGSELSYQTDLYQSHVDALVGASVVSMPTQKLTISSGQMVTVKEGTSGELYAKVLGSDNYILGEFIYNTLGGITVESGGELYLSTTSSNYGLPTIANTGGTVWYYDDTMDMTEYYQTSGQLQLNSGISPYIETLSLTGGTLNDNVTSIQCEDFYVKSGLDLKNTAIEIYGDATISGTIANSDLSLVGSKAQTITGTGTVENLTIDNSSTSGVTVENTITVTDTVSNLNSTLKNGTNIILQGDIGGDIFNGDITLDGVKLTAQKQINGNLQIKNGVTATTLICKDDITALSGASLSLSSLQLSGTTEQEIDCPISTYAFSNYNTIYDGVVLLDTVDVSGQLRSGQDTIETNDYLHLQTGASFPDDIFYGDVVIEGSVTEFPTYFNGSIAMEHDVDVTEAMMVQGRVSIDTGITCTTSAPLTVDGMLYLVSSTSNMIVEENATLTTNGDLYSNGTVNSIGKVVAVGDLITTGSTSLANLYLSSSSPQILDGVMTVGNLVNQNTSSGGVTIEDTIKVTDSVESKINSLNAGSNLLLQDGATFIGDVFYGDVIIQGDILQYPTLLEGDVTIQSDSTINRDATFNGSLYIDSGTFTVESSLYVAGICVNSDTMIVPEGGQITMQGDLSLENQLTGDGTLTLYGDLSNNGTLNINTLELISLLPKMITGNNFTVHNLIIKGSYPVTLSTRITCDIYSNADNAAISDSSNILILLGDNLENTVYENSMYITGDWTIGSGETFSILGGLYISGSLVLEEGATLWVQGVLSQTGGSSTNISVADLGLISVGKYANITAGSMTIDGTAQFKGDVNVSNATIEGSGSGEFWGDLYFSSGKISALDTVSFVGKAPQSIWGTVKCSNLVMDNPSLSGVNTQSTIYYTDTFTQNQTIINGNVVQQ